MMEKVGEFCKGDHFFSVGIRLVGYVNEDLVILRGFERENRESER